METNKLPKYNRLASRKHIAMLFKEGHIIKLPPCTVFYLQKERKTLSCNKVLFTVSKRNVPSAVRRNRIKRLLREAYRTNRHILDDVLNNANCELVFLIGYVYTGKEEKIHYPILKGAVVRSLQHFSSLLNSKTLK